MSTLRRAKSRTAGWCMADNDSESRLYSRFAAIHFWCPASLFLSELSLEPVFQNSYEVVQSMIERLAITFLLINIEKHCSKVNSPLDAQISMLMSREMGIHLVQ